MGVGSVFSGILKKGTLRGYMGTLQDLKDFATAKTLRVQVLK